MAKLNRNSVLCNVAVNDNVVAGRMDIGSQRASMQAAAILSQGRPACAGLEPTPAGRVVWALVSPDYADTSRGRTGRSETCPHAGAFVLPRRGLKQWPPARLHGFKQDPMQLASPTRLTSDR
jgi:hypothetical protein